MKFKIDTRIIFLVIGLALGISFSINMASAYYSEPGSTSDPLVTLSYVEMKIEQLKEDLRGEFSSSQTSMNTSETTNTDNSVESTAENTTEVSDQVEGMLFKVIELKAGDRVYLGESTEFILRTGQALTIAGTNGGLSDLTDGLALEENDEISKDHLVLSARGDGRGIDSITDGWILIKGKFSIIKK